MPQFTPAYVWLVLCNVWLPAPTADEPLPDPLPFRRVLIPSDGVQGELDRIDKGVLLRMSRREFEERVQRAARAAQQLKNRPRLVNATYRATLTDTDLVGTGQWDVLNRTANSAVLPVHPLNLALHKCRSPGGAGEFTDAVIGFLDGANLGLLVDGPKNRLIYFDWSLRGDSDGGGIRFDFQVPAATAASLELSLPNDRIIVSENSACLLSGPHAAEVPNRQIWRVAFPAISTLSLRVLPAIASQQRNSIVFADTSSVHALSSGSLHSVFQFNIETGMIGVQELRFDVDALLRPYSVEVAGKQMTWEVVPPTETHASPTLVVRTGTPLMTDTIVIRCVAPSNSHHRWTCPHMHMRDAINQADTIQIRMPPEIQLDDWESGDYQVDNIRTGDDGWQALNLKCGKLSVEGRPTRPTASIVARRPFVKATTFTWWNASEDTPSVITQLMLEASSGDVQSVPLTMPRGWEVDQITASPKTVMRAWSVTGNDQVSVDFVKPIHPVAEGGTSVVLTVCLRPMQTLIEGAAVSVAFPQVVPTEARIAEAVMAIAFDRRSHAEIQTSARPMLPGFARPAEWLFAMRFFRSRHRAIDGTLQSGSLPAPTNDPNPAVSAPSAPGAIPAPDSAAPTIDRLDVNSFVNADGLIMHSCAFDVVGWRFSTISVTIPPEAMLISARVKGQWISDQALRGVREANVINLPMRSGASRQRVELYYSTSHGEWQTWTRIEAPLPTLPAEPKTVTHAWHLPQGIEPLSARHETTEEHSGSLVMIRQDVVRRVGAALAVLLIGLAVVFRRSSSIVCGLAFALWLAIGLAGLAWLPISLRPLIVWPTLTGGILAGAWIFKARFSRVRTASAAGTVVALWCFVGVAAQNPPPSVPTVFIVSDDERASGQQVVYSEPDLLDRLDSLIRRAASPVSRPTLVSAVYEGVVDTRDADIRAEFLVYSPTEHALPLALPLSGVLLHEALLNGAPVSLGHRQAIPPRFPETYTVDVKGAGMHRLSLRFKVERLTQGTQNEVRFGIPALPQSRLRMEIHGTTRPVYSIAHWGRSQVRAQSKEGISSSARNRLECDLGRVGNIHIRWRVDGTQTAPAQATVQEAYLWSVRPGMASLAALWQYIVTKGEVQQLRIEIPDEIEVKKIGVQRLHSNSDDNVRPRLEDWSVTRSENKRILQINLSRPVCHGVQVSGTFVNTKPMKPKWVVPIPAPRQTELLELTDTLGYVAHRTADLNYETADGGRGVERVDAKSFRELWTRAKMPELPQELQVYSFRRSRENPVLSVAIRSRADSVQAIQHIRCSVGRRHAEFDIDAAIDARHNPVGDVEWDITQTVEIVDVYGPNVRSWSRSGSRLLVWLKNSASSANIRIAGVHALNADPPHLGLPTARIRAATSTNFIDIVGMDGLAPVMTNVRGLLPLPSNCTNAGNAQFVTNAQDYEGRIAVVDAKD